MFLLLSYIFISPSLSVMLWNNIFNLLHNVLVCSRSESLTPSSFHCFKNSQPLFDVHFRPHRVTHLLSVKLILRCYISFFNVSELFCLLMQHVHVKTCSGIHFQIIKTNKSNDNSKFQHSVCCLCAISSWWLFNFF